MDKEALAEANLTTATEVSTRSETRDSSDQSKDQPLGRQTSWRASTLENTVNSRDVSLPKQDAQFVARDVEE